MRDWRSGATDATEPTEAATGASNRRGPAPRLTPGLVSKDA
jgi:hypothetical protein